jgi:hypothetical protein
MAIPSTVNSPSVAIPTEVFTSPKVTFIAPPLPLIAPFCSKIISVGFTPSPI